MVDIVASQSVIPLEQYSMTHLKGRALYGHGRPEELRRYVAAVVKGAAAAYDAAIAGEARVSEFWPVAKELSIHQEHIVATLLLRRGYDGLIFTDSKGAIAGHVFFQRKDRVLHMFNVYVDKSLRAKGLCKTFLKEFIEYARKNLDITHVRIGAGGHAGVVAVSQKFAQCAESLRIVPEPAGRFGGEHYFRLVR